MAFNTDLLYYKNPYKNNFEATVLSVEKTSGKESLWDVILDKTFFYPEGGGQPSDSGTIAGIKVVHVLKKDGEVIHRMISPPEMDKVNCLIDWEHRFDYMQQHTGQHIISGALYTLGYGTVSVHQGSSITTIEIDKPDISEEDLKTIETLSNSTISKNINIESKWVTDAQLDELSLRRKSKVSGKIRIVNIDGYDQVACGGVHTKNTGEVECVKYVSVEKIRGHARLGWKIGSRVIIDHEEKTSIITSLSSTFSAPQTEILTKVQDLLAGFQENKKLFIQLEERYINLTIKKLFQESEKIDNTFFITAIFENESRDFLRNIVNLLEKDGRFLICLINKSKSNFQWILTINGIEFPFAEHKQNLLNLIDARGGGKVPVWQGIGNKEEDIDKLFDALRTLLINM